MFSLDVDTINPMQKGFLKEFNGKIFVNKIGQAERSWNAICFDASLTYTKYTLFLSIERQSTITHVHHAIRKLFPSL